MVDHLFSSHSVFFVIVLEARIQQLQSDGILDVQHAKVHVLKAPASGKGSPSGKLPKSTSHEKGDTPKQTTTPTKGAAKGQSSKSGPSRWLEKLSKERTKKIEKAEKVQQKLWKNVKEKPQKKVKEKQQMKVTGKLQQNVKEEPLKNLKEKPATKLQGGLTMKPAQSHKTISSSAAKLRTSSSAAKSAGSPKWADKIRSAEAPASAGAAAAAVSHKVSKKKGREQAQSQPGPELQGQAREAVGRSLKDQSVSGGGASSSSSSSSGPEHLLRDREQDIQFGLHSYLEACVFSGDVERANAFLLGQHRILNRRKLLKIGMYNILMRIWAKKVNAYICVIVVLK